MNCKCGRVLLADVGERTVRIVSGEEIPFSRRTDHVVCPACLRSYPVQGLRVARPPRDSLEVLGSLVEQLEIADGLFVELRDADVAD